MGWLSDYQYRKKVTISGTGGAGENYSVKLKIGSSSGGDFHLEGHCEDFPNDIRFTDNDGTTLLDYWIEDPSQDPITVWVEVKDNLDNDVDIYCYYRKSGESSLSNGVNTFSDFFDDFDDEDISDYTTVQGSWQTANENGDGITKGTGSDTNLLTHNTTDIGTGKVIRAKIRPDNDYSSLGVVFGYQDSSNFYHVRVNNGSNELQIYEWVSSSASKKGSASVTINTGTWYIIEAIWISANSVNAKLYDVNGNELASASATMTGGFSDGKIGFRTYHPGGFDDFLVRKHVSPEPAFSSAGEEESNIFNCIDLVGLSDKSFRTGPIIRSCTDIFESTSSSSRFLKARWLPGFAYRKRLTISGSSGAGTGYQVKLKIGSSSGGDFHLEGHCDDFPNDIRFTKDDGLSLLNYWIEDSSEDPVTVWVKIEDNLDSDVEICCYYGSSLADSLSNSDNVFELFDDFDSVEGEYSGAWCWFQDPRVVRYVGNHDRTYVGWVNPDGDIRIASVDHDTGEKQTATLHTGLEVDDHAAPAILVRNDGRLLVAYTKHDDNTLRWRISTNPEDITSWGSEKTKSFSGAVTYANLIQLSAENNKIYVFLRGTGKKKWLYCTSDDGGETFGSPTTLISIGTGEHQYLKITTNGVDKIYFAHSGHPHFETPSIYYFYYYNGALYKADGTKIGDVPDDLPINRSQMDLVYDATAEDHYKAWIWDIAMDGDTPYVVFATFPAGADEDHRYNYGRWTGSAWETHEVVSAGGRINNSWYSGGISIDKSDVNTIYYSKEFSGKWKIQKRTTSDGGSTWSDPVDISTKTDYTHNVRPVVPRNPHPSLKVLWMYGEYNYYTNYETVIEPITTHDPPMLKWHKVGSPTIVDSTIELNGDDDIYSRDTFGVGHAVIAKAKADEQDVTFVKFGGEGIDPTTSCSILNSDADYDDIYNRYRITTRTESGTTRSHHDGSDFRDTYYQYEIARVAGKVKFRQGDTWLAEHTTNLPEDSLPVGAAVWDSSQASTLTLDWILVRKFTDPEPSFVSAQTEEGPVFTCGDILGNLSRNWWAIYGSSSDVLKSSSTSSVYKEIFPACLETLSCSDVPSSILSLISRSQDLLGLTDSNIALVTLLLNAIDSIDVSDGCTLSLSFSSSCLDVLHAIDSASYPLPNVVSCLDSLGTQDSISSFLSMLCQSKDNIGGADGETSQLSVERALLDILAFQDTSSYLAGIIASASDVLNVQDLNNIRLTFSCSSIDIVKNVDSGGVDVTFHLDGNDILKGADFVSGNLQVLLDSLSVFKSADQSASSLLGFILRSATDVLDMYDLNTATLQIFSSSIDVFRTEDNSSINIILHLNSADVFKNSDSTILSLQALLSALETLKAGDSSTASVFAEILASASDLLATSDYNTVRLEFLGSAIDIVESVDNASSNVTLHLNSSDLLGGTDRVTAKLEALLSAISKFKSSDESQTYEVIYGVPVKIFKAQHKILVFRAE